ncbi:serine/threonine protein kinase [Stieleria sp. JC731]|uniref:serine/threonine-protein kinase n=1 Tax=Pirellulaceae TaxID=2691357 RepID=UPI001E3BE4C5|nr:serine/threonine-protein kinase [Stieleria sp. JC731]MCC9599966.1 serine/threonine protein kinase [Stieleria sp. JC731]
MVRSTEQREPVEVLCEQFLEQWRNGSGVSIEEFASRHEEAKDDILTLFPMMLAMESVKENRVKESSPRPVQLRVDRLEQLGDYRIIREIGRGGMAIVFEAEQQSLHRRVALKVFPAQAFEDSDHLIRFEREAKMVAGLYHHNIVPVYGTGEQDGLHYFVMQLIDGMTLDQFTKGVKCDQHDSRFEPLRELLSHRQSHSRETPKLESAERLIGDAGKPDGETTEELRRGRQYWHRIAHIGKQVAEALQYAHQKGILHRDIKPSNLILDADWRVWVTDFGLAHELTHDPISRTGDIVGTLPYMAPERLNGITDVRSDVYSLGLTLYELLTYQTAIGGISRSEIRRKVLDGDVPPPRSISKDIPKDLETIIMKAVMREPHSRYPTAQAFADDLDNYLHDRPIQARRTGSIDRLRRWSRRNPAAACMSFALLLCITVSMLMVTLQWRRAVAEGGRAESNLSLALHSMDRLLERFESDWMEHPSVLDSDQETGPAEMRFVVSDRSASVLQEALSFYEQFAEQNEGDPRLNRDTARAYRRVGGIYERLGHLRDAESAYRSELKTLQSMEETPSFERLVRITETYNRLAIVLNAEYRHKEAREQLFNAIGLLNNRDNEAPDSAKLRYMLALSNHNLGKVLWWLHAFRDSNVKHRSAIALLEKLVDEFPEETIYRHTLAKAYRDHRFSSFRNDRQTSRALEASAICILEDLVNDYPDVPDYRCELSELLEACSKFGSARPTEKEDQARRALELSEQLVAEYPAIPRYQASLARSLSTCGSLAARTSLEEAAPYHRRSVAIYSRLCKQFPNVYDYLMFTAHAIASHAECQLRLGNEEDARLAFRAAVSRQEKYLQMRPESFFGKKWLEGHLWTLVRLEKEAGRLESADFYRQKAKSLQRKQPSRSGDDES